MKKCIKYFILVLTCLCMTACANGETKAAKSDSETTTTTATTTKFFEVITATNENSTDSGTEATTTSPEETSSETVTTAATTPKVTTTPKSSDTNKTVKQTTTTYKKNTTPTTTTTFIPVVDSFFNDALFVGDSVSLKLKLYCLKQNNNGKYPLGHATFFTAGSYSWNNSLWDTSRSDSVHPLINGRKMKIADAVVATKAKKVFLMLGINDLGPYGVDGALSAAKTVVKDILKKSPNTKIYIQSVTPIYPGCERGSINNSNVKKLNEKLKKYCKDNGYVYLDIWSQMGGDTLLREYCSDPNGMGIHFTDTACKKWITYLNNSLNVTPEVYTTTTTTTKKPVTTKTTTTTKVTTTTVTQTTPVTVTTTVTTEPPQTTTETTTSDTITEITTSDTITETEVSSSTEEITSTSISSEGEN